MGAPNRAAMLYAVLVLGCERPKPSEEPQAAPDPDLSGTIYVMGRAGNAIPAARARVYALPLDDSLRAEIPRECDKYDRRRNLATKKGLLRDSIGFLTMEFHGMLTLRSMQEQGGGYHAVADKDGQFLIRGLPPGAYLMLGEQSETGRYWLEGVRLDTSATKHDVSYAFEWDGLYPCILLRSIAERL